MNKQTSSIIDAAMSAIKEELRKELARAVIDAIDMPKVNSKTEGYNDIE